MTPEPEVFALTPAQQVWAQTAPAVHRLSRRLPGPIDRARLAAALRATGQAFEALRTRFPNQAGLVLPVQAIDPAPPAWLHEPAALDAAHGPVAGVAWDGECLTVSALTLALDRRGLVLWLDAIERAYAGTMPGDTIQPADAAEGLAALTEEAQAAPALAHWRRALDEAEPPGRLPGETVTPSGRVALIEHRWTGDAPSPAAALALWQAWLAREAGLSRATVGVELSGRDADLADALGNYARECPSTLSLAGALAAVEAAAAAWLDQATGWMLIMPQPSGSAVDGVAFAYGFSDRSAEPMVEGAELPCRLRLILRPDGFALAHDDGRFDTAMARLLADRFAGFVAAALAEPQRPLATLPCLSPTERGAVLAASRGPALPPSPHAGILDLIAEVIARSGDRPALTDAGGTVDYRDFWTGAGRVAAALAAAGVVPGDRVALVAPRQTATVIALIGILRAGAVAVPIDPAYPPPRQALLIEDVAGALVLAGDVHAPALGHAGCRVLTIAAALGHPTTAAPPMPAAEDGAYILHTSGSTGRPKGVLVRHGNLLASTRARFAYYADQPGTFLLTPSLSFDSSVAGLYWTLAAGGRLLLPAPGEERDPVALARLIAREGASHWLTVPALYQAVLTAAHERELASLTDVIVAGEACPPGLVGAHARCLPHTRFHNEYGPTEATVWCTAWSWDGGPPSDPLPIGRPIPGAATYLLDESGAPVPDDVPGEIHVGGAGVAAGYLGQPTASAGAFRPDPFAEAAGGRLYATGDLARRGADGTLVYLGRIDRQLKIRGRRIEPREIEAALDRLPGVTRSAVLLREDRPGERRLVGYVQHPPADFDPAAARAALATALPDWLVPYAIVPLAAFPMSANGKLDGDALPAPEWALRPAYRAPATRPEQVLAAAVAALVGVAEPGLDDDFFALGGDSLMALQIAARLRADGFALSVRSIFATPKLEALAALMQPAADRVAAPADTAPAPLTPIQRWFQARDLPDARHYNQAVAFEITERLTLDRLTAAVERLVAHHPALRSAIEPDGAGWRQRPLVDADAAPGWFDLRPLPAALRDRVLRQKIDELQRGLDPATGRMLRIAGFRRADGSPDLLVAVVHHLAVDARSWPVLAEDLAAAYRGTAAAPALGYDAWARALAGEAGQDDAWRAYLDGAAGRLPRDRAEGANREADAAELTLTLPAPVAQALARWPGGRPGRRLSDGLLATLVLVLGDWAGHERLLIDVEGSGRDVPASLPDPSRTIGWLTTLAPLALPHRPGETRAARLAAAADAIAAAPADWSYALHDPAGPRSGAEFCVNFLGGRADGATLGGLLRPATLDLGPVRGAANPRAHLIELEAETDTDGLHLLWRYPATLYDPTTIDTLARRHIDQLTSLAETAA